MSFLWIFRRCLGCPRQSSNCHGRYSSLSGL